MSDDAGRVAIVAADFARSRAFGKVTTRRCTPTDHAVDPLDAAWAATPRPTPAG